MKRHLTTIALALLLLGCTRTTPESNSQASTLEYIIRYTAGAQPDQALPMVVVLHGLGGTPEGIFGLVTRFDRPARIVLPRGPHPAKRGHSWFGTRIDDRGLWVHEDQIEDSAERIGRLTADLIKKHPTTGKPSVCGFSQGGILSFALALHHPDVFGLAVSISGWLPPGLVPAEKARAGAHPLIRALHGNRDRVVPLEPTRKLVTNLKARGFDATLSEYPGVRHAITDAMRQELFELLSTVMKTVSSEKGTP